MHSQDFAAQARRLFLIVLLLATVGCGGSRQPQGDASQDGNGAPAQSPTLEQALVELDALPTPAGVPEDTFAMLKREFEQVLREQGPGRGASRAYDAPVGNLRAKSTANGSTWLSWEYSNIGDFNLDGLVSVSDLSPIGIYFQQHGDKSNYLRWMTGSLGIVSVQLLTSIGLHYFHRVAGYEVERRLPGGDWAWIGELEVADRTLGGCIEASELDQAIAFQFEVPDPEPGAEYRVRPFNNNNPPKASASTALAGAQDVSERVLGPASRAVSAGGGVGNIRGSVSFNGTPLGGVKVELSGLPAVTTAADGSFSLLDIPEGERVPVTFSSPAFMRTTKLYEVRAGAETEQNVELLLRGPAVSIVGAIGGTVPSPSGAQLVLPANALVDSQGTSLSGSVGIKLTFIDPTDPLQLGAAPGDLTAEAAGGGTEQLASYGMLEVFIDDGSGQQGNLAPGQSAEMTFPIAAEQRASAPESIGLYSFDEASGNWIQEGSASKDPSGEFYLGSVGHFSTWNCDDPVDQANCIDVEVVDANDLPVVGAVVTYSSDDSTTIDTDTTGSDGHVCLQALAGSTIRLSASGNGVASNVLLLEVPNEINSCAEGDCVDAGVLRIDQPIPHPPVAIATADSNFGPAPLEVHFDAAQSFDPDGSIVKYEWCFEPYVKDANNWDLQWETGSLDGQAVHTFIYGDYYFPLLRVTDDSGRTATFAFDISNYICVTGAPNPHNEGAGADL